MSRYKADSPERGSGGAGAGRRPSGRARRVARRQALAAAEKIGDERCKAEALSGVVEALAQAGDLEGAQVAARQALAAGGEDR